MGPSEDSAEFGSAAKRWSRGGGRICAQSLGGQNGDRQREVVQCAKGFRFYPAQRGRQGRLRSHLRGRAGGPSTLNEGQHLEFELEESRGKTSAVNLKVK